MREHTNYGYIIFVVFVVLLFSIGFCRTVYGQDSTYIKKLENDFNIYQKHYEQILKDEEAVKKEKTGIEYILNHIRKEYSIESKRLDSLKRK